MAISHETPDFMPDLKGYTGQGAFRFWCQKVLPIVYDDSLSYYELLNKVVNYLNNVIKDVSTVEENVGNLYGGFWNLQDYVDRHIGEIESTVNIFTTFVEEYFNNLDVQDEIDAKLDEMARNGELTAAIMPAVTPLIPSVVSQWLQDNIQPTTPAIDRTLTVENAGADSKAVGDALSDIVAENYDSTKTYLAGDYCLQLNKLYKCVTDIETAEAWDSNHWGLVNVGAELDNLKVSIANNSTILGLTKIEANTTVEGWRLLSSGVASNNNSYKLVKYEVTPGSRILINSPNPPTNGASYQFQTASTVPSNDNSYLVGTPVLVSTNTFVTVPETARWLIISALKTDNACGIYEYNALVNIEKNVESTNNDLHLIANIDNILVSNKNYSFTAVGSGTWQSGYSMNEDFEVNGNGAITIIADSSNGYGSQLITLVFYSDVDKTTQVGRRDVDYTFNTNPYRKVPIPSGSVIVNIKVCLISTNFGEHTPSSGDVAYINGLSIYFDMLSLNPIMTLPQLERLDQSVIYVLPDNWKSKIQEIQSAQKGGFTFAIQTDTHFGEIGTDIYAELYPELLNNLSKLTEYVGFDFICNLGDIIRGYTTDTTEKMLEAYTEVMHRYVTNLRCPLFVIPGNHDTNAMYAEAQSNPALQINKGDMYSKLMPFVTASFPNIVQNGRSLYYYADFDNSDIRAIFLNTTDGDYTGSEIGSTSTISNDQLTWLENEALNTSKKILIFAHIPLVSGLSVNTVTNGESVMNAIYSFKNNGGTVIGCFYGHVHRQDSKIDDNGVLHLTFDRGGSCAEIVTIDGVNRTINTVGVGVSTGFDPIVNRSFSY